jgi:outer membrane biosynthesis protein TonB
MVGDQTPRQLLVRARKGIRPPAGSADWEALRARLEDDDDVPELPDAPSMAAPLPVARIAIAAVAALAAAVILWLAIRPQPMVAADATEPDLAPALEDPAGDRDTVERAPAAERPSAPRLEERPVAAPEPDPAPPMTRPRAKRPPRSPDPKAPAKPTAGAPDASLAEETRLTRAAKAALARGDAESALRSTSVHASRFPDGVLTEEREALAIRALCRLGRDADARARAGAFGRSHPSSTVARTLRDNPCEKK